MLNVMGGWGLGVTGFTILSCVETTNSFLFGFCVCVYVGRGVTVCVCTRMLVCV